jgi:pimeloyl-ACP methyl ester carboxylesterase
MSSDRVSVAVHEFEGTGRPLLLSHATGFHGHCYLPIARRLDDRFTSFALDYRGHGDTPRPDDWTVDWDRYGDDAIAAARAVAPNGGLIGFGHSMGGAGLLMAAHRDPSLFDLIVAFEPVIFPSGDVDASQPRSEPPQSQPPPSFLVEGARRRRSTFDTFEAAIANYGSKPPMNMFDPDVLRLYVMHGFRPESETVRLKCEPEHEARTFETGALHRTWDLLPTITTRVVIVAGDTEAPGPGLAAAQIAERLPNSLFIHQPDSNHFGPFIDPGGTADLIADVAG